MEVTTENFHKIFFKWQEFGMPTSIPHEQTFHLIKFGFRLVVQLTLIGKENLRRELKNSTSGSNSCGCWTHWQYRLDWKHESSQYLPIYFCVALPLLSPDLFRAILIFHSASWCCGHVSSTFLFLKRLRHCSYFRSAGLPWGLWNCLNGRRYTFSL